MPPGKKSSGKRKRWVTRVTTDSTHPPKGLFTKSASTIARTLASKKVSPKGVGSGMRMLTYFINRAGRGLARAGGPSYKKPKPCFPSGWKETKNPEAEKRPLTSSRSKTKEALCSPSPACPCLRSPPPVSLPRLAPGDVFFRRFAVWYHFNQLYGRIPIDSRALIRSFFAKTVQNLRDFLFRY